MSEWCRRYEIKGSPLSIAYGFDEMCTSGMFLSVSDERVEENEHASDEVNAVAMKIGVGDGDGDGSYFDLHTGQHGFGQRVSCETMMTFMRRYGVPEEHIYECRRGYKPLEQNTKPHDSRHKCSMCGKATTKSCSGCRCVHYCSKECQASDWRVQHKFFCKSLPFPPKLEGVRCVRGLLLPETSDKPVLVQVPLKYVRDEDGSCYLPDIDVFIKNPDQRYIQVNPLKDRNKMLEDTLMIQFRDDFMIDNISKPNECVLKLTERKCVHNWMGPIVVTKIKGHDLESPSFDDLDMGDMADLIDFLRHYTTQGLRF